jgi:hypothetical protein
MNSTATRAKSRDSCVKVKEAVAAAEGEAVVGLAALVLPTELVVVAEAEVTGVVVGGAAVSIMMLGLTEVVVAKEVDVKITSRLTLAAVAVGVVVELSLALAGEDADPTGQSMPSNVTSAFSASHDRFAALKRARMMSEERGMQKFVWAPEMRRGIDSPRVTLW